MSTSLPAPPSDLDPDHLASLGAAFMSGKLLCVASAIGLFEHLGDGPRTLDELAAATGLPAPSLRVVAFGAMLAGTYLLLSGDGDTYSVEEATPWLEGAGLRFVEHRHLAGSTSLVIAEAV